jgi:hypothetical protein
LIVCAASQDYFGNEANHSELVIQKSVKGPAMMDIQRSSEGAGTRTLTVGVAALACMLVIGFAIRFASPRFVGNNPYLGKLSTGSDVRPPATTIGNGVQAQGEAMNVSARQDPGGQEDAAGGRARFINQASEPLTEAQRATLRSIFASANSPKVDQPNFELMIGAAVAKQTPLADLPPQMPPVLNRFSGHQYVIAGDDIVIVDQHSYRVAAIIRNVK